MAGNLVKEDSSSVQDLQDPSITCSGHKRRRGSVQPSSSRAGKKSKQDIDRDHRAKKKEEVESLKAEMEELKKSKFHLEGQAFQLRMDLKETREENINLKIVEKSQSDSILELGKAEIEKLKAEMEKLKESKFHADGHAFQLRMDLKETKEEEVEKLKAEIEKLNAEIEKLNAEIEKLNAEIEKFQSNADIEKLNAEIEKFQSNAEIEKLNAEMEKLKESKFHADGQAFQSRMDLKETREENTNLKIVQKSQSDSRLELEKMLTASGKEKMNALKEEHAQEIHALKEEHAQEIHALKAKHAQELLERDRKFNALKEEHEQHMRVCAPWGIDVEYLLENAGEIVMQN